MSLCTELWADFIPLWICTALEVESISEDYFEDVRCWHISTGNLNAFIVGGPFKDIINSFIEKWDPDIAVEFEQGNNYFYGQDIYLMLGNEYYSD